MATLTIRKLDEGVKDKLRVRAARAGRSMEDEAREILADAVGGGRNESRGAELLGLAQELFGPLGGVELELPKRGVGDRPSPTFDAKPVRRKK